jgi:hypothetical protein
MHGHENRKDEYSKEWGTYYMFTPKQDDGGADGTDGLCHNDPYGCWIPQAGFVDTRWGSNPWDDIIGIDYGILVVSDEGRHIQGALEGTPDALSKVRKDNDPNQPFIRRSIDFWNKLGLKDDGSQHGNFLGYTYAFDPDLRYCHQDIYGSAWPIGEIWIKFDCGLEGGASGGPAVTDPDGKLYSDVSAKGEYEGYKYNLGPKLDHSTVSCLIVEANEHYLPPLFQGYYVARGEYPCLQEGKGWGDPVSTPSNNLTSLIFFPSRLTLLDPARSTLRHLAEKFLISWGFVIWS